MADQKISQLPSGSPAQNTDLIPIARGGANYSVTAQDIANLAPAPPTFNVPFFWSTGQLIPQTAIPAVAGSDPSSGAALGQLICYKVTLNFNCIVNKMSMMAVSGVSSGSKCLFGLYDANGNKLIDSGVQSNYGANQVKTVTLGSPVTIVPGEYWTVYTKLVANSDSWWVFGFNNGNVTPWANVNHTRVGTAANTVPVPGGTALPNTLGAITPITVTSSSGMPMVFYEN